MFLRSFFISCALLLTQCSRRFRRTSRPTPRSLNFARFPYSRSTPVLRDKRNAVDVAPRSFGTDGAPDAVCPVFLFFARRTFSRFLNAASNANSARAFPIARFSSFSIKERRNQRRRRVGVRRRAQKIVQRFVRRRDVIRRPTFARRARRSVRFRRRTRSARQTRQKRLQVAPIARRFGGVIVVKFPADVFNVSRILFVFAVSCVLFALVVLAIIPGV